MRAFIGHSFAPKDEPLVRNVRQFVEAQGVECTSGENAQSKSIAEKVKERIHQADLFIGIFTKEEALRRKEKLFSFGERVYTTSNWVIQESGFALGAGKRVLFIVEKGIHRFPELQGDLELVYFERDSLERDAFKRLSEMIQSMLGRVIQAAVGSVPSLPKRTSHEEASEKRRELDDLYQALLVEKDANKGRELYKERLLPNQPDNAGVAAFVLRVLHRLGDGKAFGELVSLANENPSNASVGIQLAYRYKEIMDFEHAANQFRAVGKLYDTGNEKGRRDYVEACSQAAQCIALHGNHAEGKALLSPLLHLEEFSDVRPYILSQLAYLAMESKEMNDFLSYAEFSLHLDSLNSGLRFDLAYYYSESGYKELALLHYKKYSETVVEAVGLNNLGVQYSVLGMQAKAVSSYSSSAQLKETLAMANLAQNYLEAGFLERAREEIKNANLLAGEGIEVHGNIGVAKNRLDDILINEAKTEQAVLERAKLQSEFLIKFCSMQSKSVDSKALARMWQTPWGTLHLSMDESTGLVKIDELVQVPEPLWNALVKGGHSTTSKFIQQQISVTGVIVGSSICYKIRITNTGTALLGERTIHEADGFMFITEDYLTLRSLEKKKDLEPEFVTWNAVV